MAYNITNVGIIVCNRNTCKAIAYIVISEVVFWPGMFWPGMWHGMGLEFRLGLGIGFKLGTGLRSGNGKGLLLELVSGSI